MRRMYSFKQLEDIANARVKALVEGGTLENAKPIYYHPISLFNRGYDNTYKIALSFIILDNNPTPYTKDTFIQWISNIVDNQDYVNLNLMGGINTVVSGAYLYCHKVGTEYRGIFVGFDKDGNYIESSDFNLSVWFEHIDAFNDFVNKIN